MRRALLTCSLLGVAFASIQQTSDAQTVYKASGYTDYVEKPGTNLDYFTINTYDLETGINQSESNAPLKILRSEYESSSSNFSNYRSVNTAGVFADGYGYFSGVEYKVGTGSFDYFSIYKVDLSDFSYETIRAQDESFSFGNSQGFVMPASSGIGGGGSAVDLTPVNKKIDDNTSAIRKNEKAIDTNTSAIRTNKQEIDINTSAIRTNKQEIDTNRTNINNLGDGIAASTALGAALSALPVTPGDAPFSCGVGSGAYSSRFAMGLGCVAKLNQRLSLNAGGSHVFGGSSNYGGGSLDSAAWRGGFVLKLGKLDGPAAPNEQLQSQLDEVKQENAAIKEKYSTIEEQNKALMARLERLEAIALGQQPATTTASLK